MYRKLFAVLALLGIAVYMHSQTNGYLNALNTSGGSGTAASFSIAYSVGETITFDNSCSYTVGVVQPYCLCLVPVNETFDHLYNSRFYPNPASNHVIVETDYRGFSGYFIFSSEGRLLESGNYDYGPVNVGGLASGTYLLRLSSSDGKIFKTVKIIKQ